MKTEKMVRHVPTVYLCAVFVLAFVVLPVSGASFTVNSEPSNGEVSAGRNLTLFCNVTGKSPFSVNWRGGPSLIPRTQNCISTNINKYVMIACDGSSVFNVLIMNVSHSEDHGSWQCANGGDSSPSLDIKVLVPSERPTISGYDQTVLPGGSSANLTCESSCSFPNTTLTWTSAQTIDQQDVTEEITYCRDELYKTTSVLVVAGRVTSPSLVDYTCTASGSNLSSSVKIQFEADPNILVTPGLDNRTLNVGLSVSFNCEVVGSPTPDVKWIKEDSGETVSNSSFLNITNAALSDSGWYICNASSSSGKFDYRKVYLQVIEATTTGIYTTAESTSEPSGSLDSLTITMVVLAASSFIINLLICIIVYKKFPDEIVAVTAAVSWVCIILTTCFVVLGDVCGIIAWRRIDPGQEIGIIVMAVILIDLGFFILGVVVGTMRGSKLQKTGSEETRTVVLRKLVHVVWSVATFGGVTLGIVIKYKHKVQDPNTRTANGGRKPGLNSVTPEAQEHTLHKRENSANSKESEASQSKVPLHERKPWVPEKESEAVLMKEVKTNKKEGTKEEAKKKKKKKVSKDLFPIQPVETPRKLPPLQQKVEKVPLV